jgi:hypothetical protein
MRRAFFAGAAAALGRGGNPRRGAGEERGIFEAFAPHKDLMLKDSTATHTLFLCP